MDSGDLSFFPYLTLLQNELKIDWYIHIAVMFMFVVFWAVTTFKSQGKKLM